MDCIRRAWLQSGDQTLALEDDEAGYACTELDLGYPEVRDVVTDRPQRDGTDDRTTLSGSRAITANIRAAEGGYMTPDQIAAMFSHWMHPAQRPELHYVLERPEGDPERFCVVRAAGYSWPISGNRTREIQLSWVAPDPTMRDPIVHTIISMAGGATGGRAYPLTFDRAYPPGSGSATTAVISSPGDHEVRPIFDIYGPITNPIVTLAMDNPPGNPIGTFWIQFVAGFIVGAGRFVRIDTDAMTATDDTGKSILGQINWAITRWPALPVAPARTLVSITGTSTTGVTQVQSRWHDRYLT